MNPDKPHAAPKSRTAMDILVSFLNFWFRKKYDIHKSNFAFANIYKDAYQFASHIAGGQFFKIYGRFSNRYKYHPLQQYENTVRKFDAVDVLANQMGASGTSAFYQALCSEVATAPIPFNHAPDLQRLDGIATLHTSGMYLYNQLAKIRGVQVAQLARDRYMRGFSRVINVMDHADWHAFRFELLAGKHVGAMPGAIDPDDAMLFALSYKSSDVKITRRMYFINDDGTNDDEEGSLLQESKQITSDFVSDFRWSQIVRSCMTIAAAKGQTRVRIWLDRLVMMETPKEERKRIYEVVNWEDFGLFAYMVCPVLRVYDRSEVEFGTDFWRKLETVMGVAGSGLVVDDYMLRQYDKSIYYGPELYKRHVNGLAVIGGGGVYVRGATLAIATAVLTDALTVAAVNEDIRTVESIAGWKAWALRTIAEGAYSGNHAFMMLKEKPFEITLRHFQTIALWESMVTRSALLTGNSYMDMSVLRSSQYRMSSLWDGVLEWVGMVHGSCRIQEREDIMRFLTENVQVDMFATATGHVASMLSLNASHGLYKRTLVVDLARYSTAENGQVTAVAEATGLWHGSVLPMWLYFDPNPDEDQDVRIEDGEGLVFTYKAMAVGHKWTKFFTAGFVLLGVLVIVLGGTQSALFLVLGLVALIVLLLVGLYIAYRWPYAWQWPWVDTTGVGEGLFNNLLMHGLYDSGIKSYYRKLVDRQYDQLRWF
eukprot:GFKZ01002288.1.p1 GENE.GFKZ01002288.1~~GFKZ01002288.1.p1  ORF type:complete len:709 (+),score=77.91 GFKZ01002288.1:288-2414(+)